MSRSRYNPFPHQRRMILTSARFMGAALKRLRIKIQTCQPVPDHGNMTRLSIVRRAGQCQMRIRQGKRIGGTAF